MTPWFDATLAVIVLVVAVVILAAYCEWRRK